MNRNLLIITMITGSPVDLKWTIDLKKQFGIEHFRELVQKGVLSVDGKDRIIVDDADDKLTKLVASGNPEITKYNRHYKKGVTFLIEYIENDIIEKLDLSSTLYATGWEKGLGRTRTLKLKYKNTIKKLKTRIKKEQSGKNI